MTIAIPTIEQDRVQRWLRRSPLPVLVNKDNEYVSSPHSFEFVHQLLEHTDLRYPKVAFGQYPIMESNACGREALRKSYSGAGPAWLQYYQLDAQRAVLQYEKLSKYVRATSPSTILTFPPRFALGTGAEATTSEANESLIIIAQKSTGLTKDGLKDGVILAFSQMIEARSGRDLRL
jgi:hypothetical protein